MSLVIASGLTIAHGASPVLEDTGFAIGEGDRIGLVGANGSGKSTLLAVLAGRHEPDGGRLAVRRGLTVGIAEQELPSLLAKTPLYDAVLEALPPPVRDTQGWRADVVLGELGFPNAFRDRPVGDLSGGWQRLALIARAWLPQPDLLLLDEPTNHLDLARILRLERWLAEEVKGPLVIVSHDREVLDRCTDRTLFLRDTRLYDFAGPYTKARQLLVEHDLAAARAREAEEAEIKRLTRSARRLASWGKIWDNEKFSKRARSIERRIEKKKDQVTYVAPPDRRNLELADAEAQANVLLRCRDHAVAAPDNTPLFQIGRLALAKGERAVIMGANGTGKSTFLRRLVAEYADRGDRIAERAAVYFNPQAVAGYFDQDLSRLPDGEAMFGFFVRTFAAGDGRVRAELIRAGFPHAEHGRCIGTLSGGERARLLFLLLKLEEPNLLLLDEPTNHRDVDGRERLEDEILTRDLTAVMVSHDRRFVDAVANRFFVIDRGRLVETDGTGPFYDSLLEQDRFGSIRPET